MDIIDIKMKKIYGLNKMENELHLKSEKKHNFIYGVNAIGKTSFSKGLEHIAKNSPYYKLINTDNNDFSIDFIFDNLNERLMPTNNFTANSDEINKRLFIFTKRYLEQNITLINRGNSNIQIGVSIAEREVYIEQVDNIIENFQKDIFENIKAKGLKTTKEGFSESSNIIKLKFTSRDKEKERKEKKTAFSNLYNKYVTDFEVDNSQLQINDFNGESLKVHVEFSNILKDFIKDAKTSFERKIKEEQYEINNLVDKDFYEHVISYLNSNGTLEKCPVCKNTEFYIDKIIKNITDTLNELLSEKLISDMNECFTKLKNIENSYFYKKLYDIFNSIIDKNANVTNIEKYIDEINDFNVKYDSYILSFIEMTLKENIKDDYDQKNNQINDINLKNSELVEEDDFINKLDQMLQYTFGNDEFKVKRFEYSENGNKYYGVQLILNGIMKDGISVTDFWREILSESQKTKISLAFMFAVIIYNNYDGKILCVFDDPIDSYDSINKYKMSQIIYNFIEKKNIFSSYNYDCYNLIFSHSIEYMRLFRSNFKYHQADELLNYFILTKNEISLIPFNKLYILDGDFSILNKVIKDSNDGVELSLDKYIAILPIIRELANISRNAFDSSTNNLNIDNKNISDLNKYISRNILHGYNGNLSINELYNYISDYIRINILEINNQSVFEFLNEFIDNNIQNFDSMNLYEQIFFKNNIAIYIRAKLDNELSVTIKNEIKKYQDKNIDYINNHLRTMQSKISILEENKDVHIKYFDLISMCFQIKPMLNDFAHSANIFLTPLIDVEINELIDFYNNLSKI